MGAMKMHSRKKSPAEQAILRLVSDFPDLFGPVGIQLALKTILGMPPAEAARAGQLLVLLESHGLISRQDLGKGCFVYRATNSSAGGFRRRATDDTQRGLKRMTPLRAPPREAVLS
jgi:hypothetical protein